MKSKHLEGYSTLNLSDFAAWIIDWSLSLGYLLHRHVCVFFQPHYPDSSFLVLVSLVFIYFYLFEFGEWKKQIKNPLSDFWCVLWIT